MSNLSDEYEMEAGTSGLLETCEESRMLIETVDTIVDKNTTQDEDYFVVNEVDGEQTNLIQITDAEKLKLDGTDSNEEKQPWVEICRICANTSDHLIPIFKEEGLEHELNNKIHKYLPIQVSEEDNLPLHLCYHCAATLLAWHELVDGCLDAEQRLLQMRNEFQQKDQSNTLDAGSAAPTTEDNRVSIENQLSDEDVEVRGESNEESNPIDSERSSRIQMPFKAVLDTQSVFWRPYKKSNQRTDGKPSVEDDTESIWIAVQDSAFDDTPMASDPLQFSDSLLQQNSREVLSQGRTKDCTKLDTEKTGANNEEVRKEEVENKCSREIRIPTTLTDHFNPPKEVQIKQIANKCLHEIPGSKTLNDSHRSETAVCETQESYRCLECGKCFKLKDSYQRHRRIHTDERPFTCHVCAKQFRDSGGLSRHLKDVHAKLKNFSCDMCGKFFASKATREDHRRTHTGERPYICEACGNTFKSKASLYIHSKLHTNEFPHPCSYCHKKFRRRQEMLAHITTHTGEKNHTCDVCSKGFRVKSELVRHKLVHSEDKPFACHRCGLAFRQKRYLNNHIKSRHIDTLRNC